MVNLLNHQLITPNEISVLTKGEKFAVNPKRIPTEKVMTSVETGIQGLLQDQKEEIQLQYRRFSTGCSIYVCIQFTMEQEAHKQLVFFGVLVLHRTDISLRHNIHHPRQKQVVLKMLVDWAKRICKPQFLHAELRHCKKT